MLFKGLIGQPPYGFPEPLRTKVLRGLPKFEGRPGENLEAVDFNKLKEDLEAKHGRTLRYVYCDKTFSSKCQAEDGVKRL